MKWILYSSENKSQYQNKFYKGQVSYLKRLERKGPTDIRWRLPSLAIIFRVDQTSITRVSYIEEIQIHNIWEKPPAFKESDK